MKNYALFYNYPCLKDVLIIVINPFLEATRYEKNEDVVSIYHEDEMIGYNIFNISKFIKIHHQGLIVAPIQPLIDVVNIILKNHHLPILSVKESSNFIIGQVVEKNKDIIKIDIESEIVSIQGHFFDVDVLDKVVVVKPNTMMPNAHFTTCHTIASKKMLMLEDSEEILKLEQGTIGEDFYIGEVKWNN